MAKSLNGFEITVGRTLSAEETTMFAKSNLLVKKLLKAQALADEIAALAVSSFASDRSNAASAALEAVKRQGVATAKALAKCVEATAERKAAEFMQSVNDTVDPAE